MLDIDGLVAFGGLYVCGSTKWFWRESDWTREGQDI
jgi:hypothetical protein